MVTCILSNMQSGLCKKCSRILQAIIKKQILLPDVRYSTQNITARRKRHYIYGFIALTSIGCGGALLLSIQTSAKDKWYSSIKSSSEKMLKRHMVDFYDDFYAGQESDWLIYSSAPQSSEFPNRVLKLISDIINFNVNRVWDWLFSWEQSKSDDPWVLLELTKSNNFWVRQMGVASLANKTDWEDYKYRLISQACDHRTTVALARYPQANKAYFLPPPKLEPSKGDIVSELKEQVAKLPKPLFLTSCMTYYRLVALDQEIPFQKDPLTMDYVSHNYSIPGEDEKRKFKVIGYCLEALASYTANPDYACMFVENHGLAALQRLYEDISENWVLMYVGTILCNVSQVPELLETIVHTGWVGVIRQWTHSSNAALSLLAKTILANLDRDWISNDLYQDIVLLHPTQRNSQPVYADLVFVHGLRGGAVKTWRQRDEPDGKKQPQDTSPCWPRDWLAKDCPNVRIISLGYNSMLHRWGDHCPYEQDKRTIEGRSRDLIRKLQHAGVGNRPIIWIGHSMGGLLIKQILTIAREESEYSHFSLQTKGVIFYSVPHRGTSVVDVMMYAKYLLFPSVEVQEMHTNSPKLKLLHLDFLDFMKESSVPCLSVGENAKTPFGRPLPKVLVVPLDSSDPGIGKFVSVPDNHINTCKPCSKNDIIYQLTLSFIQEVLGKIR